MKENDFTRKKARGKLYPKKTIIDTDDADDLALSTKFTFSSRISTV